MPASKKKAATKTKRKSVAKRKSVVRAKPDRKPKRLVYAVEGTQGMPKGQAPGALQVAVYHIRTRKVVAVLDSLAAAKLLADRLNEREEADRRKRGPRKP